MFMGSNDEYPSVLKTFHNIVENGVHLLFLVIGQEIVSQKDEMKWRAGRLFSELMHPPPYPPFQHGAYGVMLPVFLTFKIG